MKRTFLLLVFCLGGSLLSAQYDFPVVINGLSIRLDLNGQRVVYPQQWIQATISDCYPDSLLISRTVFPRDSVPPPTASDSLVFNCDDFSSESVEIWWKGQENEWLVADSYALISGFDSCNCDQDCPVGTNPIVLNGLSTAFGSGDSITVAAVEVVAIPIPGSTYSFSNTPADSMRTFYCADGPVVNVEIFAHQPGLQSVSSQTYLDLSIENCGLGTDPGPIPKVIQGLSVPSGRTGIVSVPARAFAIPSAPDQQLSYSNDPLDTILTVDCSLIGSGGISVNLYRHLAGQSGPAAISYLIADNGRQFCQPNTIPSPVNDDFLRATTLEECGLFGQFYRASNESFEPIVNPQDPNAGTVWYRFTYFGPDVLERKLNIQPLDSLYFAVYPDFFSLDEAPPAFASGLLTSDSTINLCWPVSDFSYWYLQLQQSRPNANCRYYLQLESEADCPSSVNTLTSKVAKIWLAPNPSNDYVEVSTDQGQINNISSLEIYNVNGQLVSQPNNNPFRIGHLQMGVYWVVISLSDGQRFVEKLIKI